MKKNDTLTWSLIAALCLMVVIAGVLLLKSYNSSKSNQNSMLELEVNVTNLMDELEQTKAIVDEKEKELEAQTAAYQQQIDEMQLVLNNTMDDRDTLAARVQSMSNEAALTAKNAETQQSRYDTALAALAIQKNRIEELNSQVAALKAGLEEASAHFADEQNALQGALEKSQADLAVLQQENAELKQQADAAAQTAEAQIAALNEQITQAQAAADKASEAAAAKATALSEQLSKAQADLEAANKEKETLNQTIAGLNEQLAAAQAAAAKDTEEAAAKVTALSEQLTKAQADLEAANNEKETLSQDIAALNEQLAAAQAAAGKDTEEAAAKVTALSEQLSKAQADLEAANNEKETLSQNIAALNEQLTAAQAAAGKNTEEAAAKVTALSEQLAKAQADLEAANNEKETLSQNIAALNEQLAAAQAAAGKDTEEAAAKVTALSEQLTKAQADLEAANKEKETLSQNIAALNEQLAAAQAAAGKDTEEAAAKVTALSEQLTKAQADLEAVNNDKETLSQNIAALNEQITQAQAAADKASEEAAAKTAALSEELTKAQADLEAANNEKETLSQNIAALNEQLAAAQAAAGKDTEEAAAKVTALSEELAKAQADLEAANKEKETLSQNIAALNEQLAAVNDEKKALDQTVASLNEQLANDAASASKTAEETAAQVAGLNEQLTQKQEALDAAGKEKEELTNTVASLNASLSEAEKAAADFSAEITGLNEQLAQTQTALSASKQENDALNNALNAAQNDLAQTREILVATTSAMDKAGEEAGVTITALEEKNRALADEAAGLRGSLETETQKSAKLQEELDVQSAKPDALFKRLAALSSANEPEQKDELRSLASLILRAFRESIPADTENGVTHPVPVSVLVDGQDVMTITFDFTETQEVLAYEAASKINEMQTLFRIDLNHDQTAALIVNGTAFGKEAFEAVYAEVFTRNPGASQAELNQLTADEMVNAQVLREHAKAAGIDPDAPDMESLLWEEVLKTVTVGEEDFAAGLEQRQQEEDEVLASDPAEYARMLEDGQIASAVLPKGCRFVKQLIVPVDMSGMDEILTEMNKLQKKLDEVSAIVNGQSARPWGKDMEELKQERNLLARQVSQLNSDRKLLLKREQLAKEQAASLARQIKEQQVTFETAAASAHQDEVMPPVGYAVFEGAQIPGKELVAAALALKKPGDVSAPIQLADGFHVLYYSEEITQDSAVIQNAQEVLRLELLEALRKTTQESLLNKWISEAETVLNVK